MKTIQTVLLLTLLQLGVSFGQGENDSKQKTEAATKELAVDDAPKTITIEEITREMSKGKQPGFKTELYQQDKKAAAEALTKYLKEKGKIKIEQVGNEYIVTAAAVKSISIQPVSMYFILLEHEAHVELYAFYEINNAFLTKETHEQEYLSAKKVTREYAVYAYKAAMDMQIEGEEKKLKTLQSDLEKIHKEHDNLEKKIAQEKQSIDNTKEKIATSELDQERVRGQVQGQKDVVGKTKAGGNETLLKEEEKKLKSFESEVSKLMKQEDGFHKDITNSEAAIRDYERAITDNQSEATVKQTDIEKQKEVVYKLTKKKDAIQ